MGSAHAAGTGSLQTVGTENLLQVLGMGLGWRGSAQRGGGQVVGMEG